jgi:hypothetical protein
MGMGSAIISAATGQNLLAIREAARGELRTIAVVWHVLQHACHEIACQLGTQQLKLSSVRRPQANQCRVRLNNRYRVVDRDRSAPDRSRCCCPTASLRAGRISTIKQLPLCPAYLTTIS